MKIIEELLKSNYLYGLYTFFRDLNSKKYIICVVPKYRYTQFEYVACYVKNSHIFMDGNGLDITHLVLYEYYDDELGLIISNTQNTLKLNLEFLSEINHSKIISSERYRKKRKRLCLDNYILLSKL